MEERNFYQSIVEHTSIGYSYNKILYNKEGEQEDFQFLKLNETYETILGINESDWIGKNISELYALINKEGAHWKDYQQNILKVSMNTKFEEIFTYAGKHYRAKIYSPKKDYIITSLTDVTPEMENTKNLQILFDSVPIQVWYLQDAGTYLSANKAHADFMGIERTKFIEESIESLMSKEKATAYIQENQIIFDSKQQITKEDWFTSSNGAKRLLRITKKPKLNSKGNIRFVICSAEDITDDYINKEKNIIQERILRSSIDFTRELLTNNNLDEALSNGLQMIGNAAKVDRVYYWENNYCEDTKEWKTSQRLEWCQDNIETQIDNPELQNVLFEDSIDFMGTLAQNKSFNAHVKDMKDGENTTKRMLERQGILSILVIPIFIEDNFEGFIGFDSCETEKDWSEIEISLLKSFVFLYVKAYEQNLLQREVLQIKDNFYNFFNMTEDLLMVLNTDGKVLDINNNVLERLNYSREELLGESYLIFHPENEREKVGSNFQDILSGRKVNFNISAITKDGQTFPIETTNTQGLWDGEPAIFGVIKDVSELTLSEDKFSKAFNNSGVSMFISKFTDGEILEVNDTFLHYIGYAENEVLGKTTLDLEMTKDYENRDHFIEQIETKGKITDLEINFISKDNIARTGLTNIVPITINNEACLLSSIIDISDRIENEKRILELSNRDALTNLYNRRYIYDSVEEIIADYKENDELFSVAIVDIDNFKDINDQYGHQVGDCVLVEFSNKIQEHLRDYDVLGRYGGEEFIILLNHADIKKGKKVLNRILDVIRDTTFYCNNHQIKLTFSAGLACCKELNNEDLSLDNLVGISDKRMYMAKESGKNKIMYQN